MPEPPDSSGAERGAAVPRGMNAAAQEERPEGGITLLLELDPDGRAGDGDRAAEALKHDANQLRLGAGDPRRARQRRRSAARRSRSCDQ